MDIPENESLISEICDLATEDEHSAKEAVEALETKFLCVPILYHYFWCMPN